MGFPTVKSDPFKKGLRVQRVSTLWPEAFWGHLVRLSGGPYRVGMRWGKMRRDLLDVQIEMIHDQNKRQYGI